MLKDVALSYYDGSTEKWCEISACAFHLVPDGTQLAIYASKTPHGPRTRVAGFDDDGWLHVKNKWRDQTHRFITRTKAPIEASLESGYASFDSDEVGYHLTRMGGHIVLRRFDPTPVNRNEHPFGRTDEVVLYYNCFDSLWEDEPGAVTQTSPELCLHGPSWRAGILGPRPSRRQPAAQGPTKGPITLDVRSRPSALSERLSS